MNQLLSIPELNSIIFIKEQNNVAKNRFNTFSFEEDFDITKESIQYFRSDRLIPIQIRSKLTEVRAEVYNNNYLVDTIIPDQKSNNLNQSIYLDSNIEYLDEDRYLVTFSEGMIYNETTDINGQTETINFDTLAGTNIDLTGGSVDFIEHFFGSLVTQTGNSFTDGSTTITISDEDISIIKNSFSLLKNYPEKYWEYVESVVDVDPYLQYPSGFGTINFNYSDIVDSTTFNIRFRERNNTSNIIYFNSPKTALDLGNESFYKESYIYGMLPEFLIGNDGVNSLNISGIEFQVEEYSYSSSQNKTGLVFRNSYSLEGKHISKVVYDLEDYETFEFDVSFLDKEEVYIKVSALENDVEKEIMYSEKILVDDEIKLDELVYYRSDNKYLDYTTGIKHLLNIPVEYAYDKLSNESESEKDDDSTELISSDTGVGRNYELQDISQAFARKLNKALHSQKLFINNVPFVVESYSSDIIKESNLCSVQFSLQESAPEPVDNAFSKEVPNYIVLGSDNESLIDLGEAYLF